MMDPTSLYRAKLTTPAEAVGRTASGVNLSMAMAMTEPPVLLKALADRTATGRVDDLKVYYFESTRIAGNTILRYELLDRIRPYCMFTTAVERALINRGAGRTGAARDGQYYVGLDIASALHPQALLCYEMGGRPLTPEHGAPLRLVIPVKYVRGAQLSSAAILRRVRTALRLGAPRATA
jgi:hypothetical protein